MNLAKFIPLVLQISIGLTVFCVALRARSGDLTYLLRQPSLLFRSLLAMNIIMPILAALIAGLFHLRPALEVALILLAVSPVPPILPGKEAKAGGNVSYALGLLMLSAVLAIVLVPASVSVIARLFGLSFEFPMMAVAKVLAMTVLGPLILGAIVRRLAPAFAERAEKPLSRVGMVLLLLAFLPILIKMWRAIVGQIGDFTLVAIVLFSLVSLVVGHLLGGPKPEDRTVLALSTASRHPGVAIAVAGAIATQDQQAVPATILLAVLVGTLVTAPYVKWRQRGSSPSATPSP